MFKRLDQHSESNNILAIEQFGFRKGVNTGSAIFTLTDSILILLKHHHQTQGAFCNLLKAFDRVNHDILLNKLHYYGISGIDLSYKQETKGQILNEDNSSSWETATSGVPQGSILGPLLFRIYINYLPHGLHHEAKLVIQAYDTSILVTARSTEELKTQINSTLDYIIQTDCQ